MHRVSSVPPAVLAPLINGAGTARLFVDEYRRRFRVIDIREALYEH